MKAEEIDRCQIQEWYPKFKSLSIRTVIHELSEEFVDYLMDDSGPFVLPVSVSNQDALPNRIHNAENEEDYQVDEGSDDDAECVEAPSFPDLEVAVNDSIKSLGGTVFPKLNWSSPKDAAWISTSGTLRCSSLMEIALLLRSSDSLIHDLNHAYDSCRDKTLSRPKKFYLALRKWYPSLLPQMEFRCFVRDNCLIGISQRETTTFFPSLHESQGKILSIVNDFFVDNIRMKFGSENYSFDIYVTKDSRVKIIDFNPWGSATLPLLFTWEELEANNELEFRIVETKSGIRPGLKTAVPHDFFDLSPGSGWDQLLKKAGEEYMKQDPSSEDK